MWTALENQTKFAMCLNSIQPQVSYLIRPVLILSLLLAVLSNVNSSNAGDD